MISGKRPEGRCSRSISNSSIKHPDKVRFSLTYQPDDSLNRFQCHQRPNDPSDTSHDAFLLTRSTSCPSPRDSGPDASVARSVIPSIVRGQLTVKSEGGTGNKGLAGEYAGIGDEISRQG